MPSHPTFSKLRRKLQTDPCGLIFDRTTVLSLCIVISIICGVVIGAQQHDLDYKIILTCVVVVLILIVGAIFGMKGKELCEFTKRHLEERRLDAVRNSKV